MEPFSIDSHLRDRPSTLTPAGIDKYMKTMASGLNGIGTAVLAAAEKYRINTTYIVAHAVHETGWGTSDLCHKKHNLFGWGAFDDSPFEMAKAFPDADTCIDFVMSKVDEHYLTPGGKHFRLKPCLGDKTHGMNVMYAGDKDWGRKIARIAQKLELEIA